MPGRICKSCVVRMLPLPVPNRPGPALAMLSGEVDRQSAMIGLNTAYGYMFISTLAMLPLLFFLRPGKGVAAGPVMADAH